MIPKEQGAKDNCPSCKQELVCREIEYKGEKKLQWQYADKEEAHFSFDFKTKKSSCKESKEAGESVGQKVTQSETLHLKDIDLTTDAISEISKEVKEGLDMLLARYYFIQDTLNKKGITHPATIGMFFNHYMESLRR